MEEQMLIEPGSLAEQFSTVLLDVDGVLWESGKLIEGSLAAIQVLKREGKRIIFVSNNAGTYRPTMAASMSQKLGYPIEVEELVTSAWAMASVLQAAVKAGDSIYVCGHPGLIQELEAVGLTCVTTPYEQQTTEEDYHKLAAGEGLDENVRAVCIGIDCNFTYTKICLASLYVQRGVPIYGTNIDDYNTVDGKKMPRTGCMLAAIEKACGQKIPVVGKPAPQFMDQVINRYGLNRDECLMVGDRLDTDIAFANNSGVKSCLVLSGVASKADADAAPADERPTHIRKNLRDILATPSNY